MLYYDVLYRAMFCCDLFCYVTLYNDVVEVRKGDAATSTLTQLEGAVITGLARCVWVH